MISLGTNISNRPSLGVFCLMLFASISEAAITVTFGPGSAADEITYSFSGSDTWMGGTILSTGNNAAKLPASDSSEPEERWVDTYDAPWSSVSPFLVDIETIALTNTSTFEMRIDGNLITNSGGAISGSDLRITGEADGDFSITSPPGNNLWEYPILNGGEIISWSGSGSFMVSGGITTNMNPGTHSHTDTGGITFQAIVIPEPSSTFLLGLGGLGLCFFRRRR